MTATRYDMSKTSTRAYETASGQKVAIGDAHTESDPIDAIEVMLRPTVDCFVTVGEDPEASADNGASFPLWAGESFHLKISPGDRISVVRESLDGDLYIMPVA